MHHNGCYCMQVCVCIYLEREVRMELVIVKDIPDHLVEHGEERAERSQASEVHDVFQSLGVLQAASYQPIRGEVRSQKVGTVSLNLERKREGGAEGEV